MVELNTPIKEACGELLSMFGIEYGIIEERDEDKLRSSKDINILLGLTGDIKGNLLVGATKNITLKIVSSMMGGMEFSGVDDIVISGISEFANMLGGTTITKIQTDKFIDLSPPTVVTSEGETVFINQFKSHKIIFNVVGERLTVSYCIKTK